MLKALDWNSDSELNGRMIEVYYTILPDMDGSVKEIQVVLNTRDPLQENMMDRLLNDKSEPR